MAGDGTCPFCHESIDPSDLPWRCPACGLDHPHFDSATNCDNCRFSPRIAQCTHCHRWYELFLLIGEYAGAPAAVLPAGHVIDPAVCSNYVVGEVKALTMGDTSAFGQWDEAARLALVGLEFPFPSQPGAIVWYQAHRTPRGQHWMHGWIFGQVQPNLQEDYPAAQLSVVYPADDHGDGGRSPHATYRLSDMLVWGEASIGRTKENSCSEPMVTARMTPQADLPSHRSAHLREAGNAPRAKAERPVRASARLVVGFILLALLSAAVVQRSWVATSTAPALLRGLASIVVFGLFALIGVASGLAFTIARALRGALATASSTGASLIAGHLERLQAALPLARTRLGEQDLNAILNQLPASSGVGLDQRGSARWTMRLLDRLVRHCLCQFARRHFAAAAKGGSLSVGDLRTYALEELPALIRAYFAHRVALIEGASLALLGICVLVALAALIF